MSQKTSLRFDNFPNLSTNFEKQSSLNNMEKKNGVRNILSSYSLNEKTVDRLSNEIGIIIKDKGLKFSNSFMLKRYVDKVILSLKENTNGFSDIAKILIEKGYDLDLKYDGGYIIHYLRQLFLIILILLVDNSIDINSKNPSSQFTPIFLSKS